MQWHMDLVEANVKRILNVLDAIEFAAGSWNIIGRLIIRNCWIKSDIIEAPQIAACTKWLSKVQPLLLTKLLRSG